MRTRLTIIEPEVSTSVTTREIHGLKRWRVHSLSLRIDNTLGLATCCPFIQIEEVIPSGAKTVGAACGTTMAAAAPAEECVAAINLALQRTILDPNLQAFGLEDAWLTRDARVTIGFGGGDANTVLSNVIFTIEELLDD
jgi:hypothetical protein